MIRRISVSLVAALTLAGCTSIGSIPDRQLGKAVLAHANGLPAGTATLTAAGDSVTLSIAAIGLQPGSHGLHIHAVGKCETPGFTSAGPHFNPGAHQHGSANPAGSHLGDLPNLVADSHGAATLSTQLTGTSAELAAQLFDADGTAIVIHAAADDYRTDPSGNSGARIACGVVLKAGS